MSYIKGKQLMVQTDLVPSEGEEYSRRTIAFATSHSMELSSTTGDTSTKDDDDRYENKEVTGQSWSLTTENLIAESPDDPGVPTYEDLLRTMRSGEAVLVRFTNMEGSIGAARKGTDWTYGTDHDYDAEDGNTQIKAEWLLRGKAVITSLELNAENKENVSYSATFTGVGAPTVETV